MGIPFVYAPYVYWKMESYKNVTSVSAPKNKLTPRIYLYQYPFPSTLCDSNICVYITSIYCFQYLCCKWMTIYIPTDTKRFLFLLDSPVRTQSRDANK